MISSTSLRPRNSSMRNFSSLREFAAAVGAGNQFSSDGVAFEFDVAITYGACSHLGFPWGSELALRQVFI